MQTAEGPTFAPAADRAIHAVFQHGVGRHKSISRRPAVRPGHGRCDWSLIANEEPPLGSHLVTPRSVYTHHGVYVGDGAVVHYGAFGYDWRRRPVEQVSLELFAHGHPICVRPGRPSGLTRAEIVRRARSRLGEDQYRVLSNNCEHFSEWCVNGEHRSPQVDRWLAPLLRVRGALHCLARLRYPARKRSVAW